MKLTLTGCIEAPKEQVWKVLSDLSRVDQWIAQIRSAKCLGDQSKGVGTVRVCDLSDSFKVRERFVDWDEGHGFLYCAENLPMVSRAANRWSIESFGQRTLVTTESEVILKGGIAARVFSPLMVFWSRKMGLESLAALKYLVEKGHPYQGKHRSLPKAPSLC